MTHRNVRDWLGFGVSSNILKFALIALFFGAACDGGCSGCGCGGFENTPYPPNLYTETVQKSGQIRVTPTGFDFIEQNIPTLIEAAIPGGLAFCVPEQSGAVNACYGQTCSTGETGCDLTLTIDDAEITPQPTDTLQVDVTVGGLDEELPIRVIGADCKVQLKSKSGNAGGAQIDASVPITFTVESASPTRDVKIEVGDLVTDLSDVDIDIAPSDPGNIGQILACGLGNFATALSLVNTIINLAVGPLLSGAIGDITREQLCTPCDMGQCPTAATCAGDDICEYGNGECVPLALGIEGRLLLGDVLADFTEHPEAGLDMLVKVADHAEVNDGLVLGMRSGFQPDKIERCAPVDPGKRPDFLPIPISQTITGNTKPNGQPFMFGIGYHKKAIQHLLWSTWASGATCLRVDSDSIGDSFNLSAGTIGALVPSLKKVSDSDAGLFIKIVPQFAPDVILGANTVTPMGNSYTVNDPLMTIDWKDLDIHMYFFAQDRWTRVFTLRGDIVVPVAIVPDGMGQIVPVIGDVSNAITNVRVREAGMVAEDEQQKLVDLIPTLVGAALPSLLGSVSDPIALPELFGLEFVFEEGDITSVDNNEMLALFASLRAAPQTIVAGVHPAIAKATVKYGQFESGMVKPHVELDVFGIVSTLDSEAEIEFAYKVDDGWWSLYEVNETLRIDDPRLLIPGEHQIQVKARLRGVPETTTAPIQTTVLVDWDNPEVLGTQYKAGRFAVEARDLVDKKHDLNYRFRVVGEGLNGEWSGWSDSYEYAHDSLLPDLVRVDVEVRDRTGNIGQRTDMVQIAALTETKAPVAKQETGPKAGCNSTGGAPTGWLALLLMGGLLAFRRRRGGRRVNPAWLLAGVIAMSGCSCDDDETGTEACDCPSNTYCNDAKECVPGCAADTDCPSGKKCEANACVDDCEQLCAGSCRDDEFGTCSAEGECACVPFCEEGCGDEQYCCYTSNACEGLPDPCVDQVCEPGFEPAVQTAPTGESASCEITAGTCECVELPPLPMGIMGMYLDVYRNAGVTAAAFYNDTYGDLVVATFDASLTPTYYWVDGVPATGTIAGSLNGPRGGISTPGDDLGRYSSIVVDGSGNLHVFYRDGENDNLKYARGTGGPDYQWEFATLDSAVGAGLWTDAELVGDTIHLVYTADNQDNAGTFEAQLKHATFDATAAVASIALAPTTLASSAASNPCGIECERREECFSGAGVCEEPATDCAGDCPTGSACRAGACTQIFEPGAKQFASTTGLHNQLSKTSDGLLLTFYDHLQGSVGWTQFANDAWGMTQFVGAPSGPYGSGFVDANGNLHLAYMDVSQPALVYQDVANATTEVVVDGARDLPGQWYITDIGEDVTIRVDTNDNVVLTYHDASLHTFNRAIRAAGNWSSTVLGDPGSPYTGAHGFYSSLWQVADESLAIEMSINQQNDPSEAVPVAYEP